MFSSLTPPVSIKTTLFTTFIRVIIGSFEFNYRTVPFCIVKWWSPYGQRHPVCLQDNDSNYKATVEAFQGIRIVLRWWLLDHQVTVYLHEEEVLHISINVNALRQCKGYALATTNHFGVRVLLGGWCRPANYQKLKHTPASGRTCESFHTRTRTIARSNCYLGEKINLFAFRPSNGTGQGVQQVFGVGFSACFHTDARNRKRVRACVWVIVIWLCSFRFMKRAAHIK